MIDDKSLKRVPKGALSRRRENPLLPFIAKRVWIAFLEPGTIHVRRDRRFFKVEKRLEDLRPI